MVVFVVALLIISFVVMFGYQIFREFGTDIQNDLANHNESVDFYQEIETRYPSTFDALIMLILFGLWAVGIAAAYMSDQHPMVFGFMMLVIVFILIAGAMFANYYEEFFGDALYSGLTASFPMANWALTHLLEITIMVSLSIVLALMGKNVK